jgi:polysaccharide export outer membrane protein
MYIRRTSAWCAALAVLVATAAAAQTPPQRSPATAASAAAPAPAAPTADARTAAPEYKISRGDKLRIEVYKDSYLSQSVQVRPDGRITLPLAGDLGAEGLTSIQLRDRISTLLKEYVANPVVTVIVVETVDPVVYVMGEVNNPGSVPIRGPLTVLQALAVTGGFKDFANPRDIKILRRGPDGATVATIPFNYKDAIKPDAKVVYLQPGDTVVVP